MSFIGFSQAIKIEQRTAPVVDGTMLASEWGSNHITVLSVGGSRPVKVLFQRSDTALYFAFAGNLDNTTNPNFPEIYLDMNHSRSSVWEADDHWFHVSATDCHSKGKYSDYSNCIKQAKDWTAERNWMMSTPDPDSIEIIIPFSKIGLDLSTTDSIGIAFGVTNTATRYEYWPDSAKIGDPSTWATAYFKDQKPTATHVSKKPENSIMVYPNPVERGGTIHVSSNGLLPKKIRVLDLTGREVPFQLLVSDLEFELTIKQAGSYILMLTDNQGLPTYKTLIIK